MCSELVSDNGEFREVGFFNEHRDFGNWFRTSIAEILFVPSVRYKYASSLRVESAHTLG